MWCEKGCGRHWPTGRRMGVESFRIFRRIFRLFPLPFRFELSA
jgi:hypothetical protein